MVQLAGRAGIPNLLGSMAARFLLTSPGGDGQMPVDPSSRLAGSSAPFVDPPPRPLSRPHRPVDTGHPVGTLRSVGAGRPAVGRPARQSAG